MFYGFKSLTSLNLSNFKTPNVTYIDAMFYDCISLAFPDISNFKTTKVTNLARMFYNCHNITLIGCIKS